MAHLGERLRKERRRRGLALDEVHASTKIQTRYLAALERREWGALPGEVFLRGYLRTYAEFLKLDPEQVLKAYARERRIEHTASDPETDTEAEGRRAVRAVLERIGKTHDVALKRRRRKTRAVAIGAAATALCAATAWVTIWTNAERADAVPGARPAPARPAAPSGRATIHAEDPRSALAGAAPASRDTMAEDDTADAAARSAVSAPTGSGFPAPTTTAMQPSSTAGLASRHASTERARTSEAPGDVSPSASKKPVSSSALFDVASQPRSNPSAQPPPGSGAITAPSANQQERPLSNPEAPSSETVLLSRESETPHPPPATTGLRLTVPRYGVGTGVVDHHLIGQGQEFAEGTAVWFWTLVDGGRPGDHVRHVWMHENRRVGEVRLRVGSPQWRTQSRRMMEQGSAGTWTVEARDPDDQLLASSRFRVAPRPEAAQ